MKELIKLAKKKGFCSKFHIQAQPKAFGGRITSKAMVDEKFYLWMCELQNHIHDKYRLHIVIIPTVTGHYTFKIVDVQLDPENKIERPPYKNVHNTDYNNPKEALRQGLLESLKLIDK